MTPGVMDSVTQTRFTKCPMEVETRSRSPVRTRSRCPSLEFIQIGERSQFKTLLRATLVSNAHELERFEALYQAFWHGSIEPPDLREVPPSEGQGLSEGNGKEEGAASVDGGATAKETEHWEVGGTGGEEERQVIAGLGFVDEKKDFSQLHPDELGAVQELVLRMALRLGLRLSRRFQAADRARKIDFRRSFRSALRYGGELIDLRYRRPKAIPSRIHLALDVSGSMDIYNRFFVVFMYGLQKALANARCFLFSTHLTPVTHLLKSAPFQEAWQRIQAEAVNWSGGTDIGNSLMRLYTDHLGSGTARRAVVMIVSDGWDRGDPSRLGEAMGLIHQRCRHLFWLNPLLASACYEPVCRGMRAALPHVDSFLPFHNLKSLYQLCHKMETVW